MGQDHMLRTARAGPENLKRRNKNAKLHGLTFFIWIFLVARGGIEPPTQGFPSPAFATGATGPGPGNLHRALPGFDWTARTQESAVRICARFQAPICRSSQILSFLVRAAWRKPRLMIAVALLALAALASTITYTGFLVVGVLADHLGTGRIVTGLLLGVCFARLPWFSKGKFHTVGLLPKRARRPVIVGLLALGMWSFLSRGDYMPAVIIGFAAAFLLTYPWMRRVIFGRVLSSVFKSPADQNRPKSTGSTVIDVEFREKKD